MSEHPKIVFNPEKASIYDNAPPGALMPWRRGTEPHPGWEWAEDLAQYDAGIYAPDAEAGWYGWIRRKSEAKEIAEAVSSYFGSQRTVVAHARFSEERFACDGIVEIKVRAGALDEEQLRAAREHFRIPHDATLIDVTWDRGMAHVRYGWGVLP